MKENWMMSTYNRLDLQALGSQPDMPRNLPDHWIGETLALPVEILVVVSLTGYMFTSSGFPLLNWGYSIDSSKMIGNFPVILNFNWLFLKLHRFICN